MKENHLRIVTRMTFPKTKIDATAVYHFINAKTKSSPSERRKLARYYRERTDRNDGYLVRDPEQGILRDASIAVVGTGGMGGPQAEIFARLGVGHIHMADNGRFDVSNIGRQPGATRHTIGHLKAMATGKRLWDVTNDFDLWVYPEGLTERTAEHLLAGRDVVVDMIEFWAIASRMLLHRKCAECGIPVVNCNSVGHSTFMIVFDYAKKASVKRLADYATLLEKAMGMTYAQACELEDRYERGIATDAEKRRIMEAIFAVFVPALPEYFMDERHSSKAALVRRLLTEGKAPIISTNPPFAAGVCATEAYFEIMRRKSAVLRSIPERKAFPYVTQLDIGHRRFRTFKIPC